jgi:hypothetical protein
VGNFTVILERLIPRDDGSFPPRRELWLVMGPYWPFCLVLTVNLMVTISLAVVVVVWTSVPLYAKGVFLGAFVVAAAALASVACRDPGLLPHYGDEPEASKSAAPTERPSRKWIYNDNTQSWRPRGAVFDRDVNAIVEGFDHVCEWPQLPNGSSSRGRRLFSRGAGLLFVRVLPLPVSLPPVPTFHLTLASTTCVT